MKGIIFCSIILICLINVLRCKHYLVEVDNDDPDQSNPANAPEKVEETNDEGTKKFNDDETAGINIDFKHNIF